MKFDRASLYLRSVRSKPRGAIENSNGGGQSDSGSQIDTNSRVHGEAAGRGFNDGRLDKRLTALLRQLADDVGEPIPFACQDWANTKAAYRFFSNPKVNEEDILSGHFGSTRERVK